MARRLRQWCTPTPPLGDVELVDARKHARWRGLSFKTLPHRRPASGTASRPRSGRAERACRRDTHYSEKRAGRPGILVGTTSYPFLGVTRQALRDTNVLLRLYSYGP